MVRIAGRHAAALIAALLLGATGAPGAIPTAGAQDLSATLYEGACAGPAREPADALGALAPIAPADEGATGGGGNGAPREARGIAPTQPVLRAEATIEVGLDHLLDEGAHSIGVHRGGAAAGELVACGDLGGVVDGGRLAVAVRSVGASGVVGVAILDAGEGGGPGGGTGPTRVTLYLLSGGEPPESRASPTP